MTMKPLWKDKINIAFIWTMLIFACAVFWILTLDSMLLLLEPN
jgi:hypothetical protein